MLSALPRQNYFELIPTRSNRFKSVLGLLVYLEQFPDQTGLFIGLNVFEPVQHFPHDLQIRLTLPDCAPALKACDCAKLTISEHFFRSGVGGRVSLGPLEP
jgi:hypothetical protein